MFEPETNPASPRQVELLLSANDLADTQSALEPLAALAKRLRYRTLAEAGVLSIAAIPAAILAAASVYGLAGVVVGILLAGGAIVTIARFRSIWKGSLKPLGSAFPPIVLPIAAQLLLDDVKRGAVRVRFATDARPLMHYQVLPKVEANGPFAPLLLSSDPEISRLALWSLFVGDKLTLLFEVAGPQNAESIIGTLAGRRTSATFSFNKFIHLPADELDEILALAFPLEIGDTDDRRYNLLVCLSFRIAREQIAAKEYKGMKPLIKDVCDVLNKRERIYDLGLRPNSKTPRWMEDAFSTRGYDPITNKLVEAAAQIKSGNGQILDGGTSMRAG